MLIKRIYVRNFRNIKEAELEFCGGCNILCGGNAQGKTNMLEAISICLGRSFRMASISRISSFIPFLINENSNKNTLIKLSYVSDSYPERENIVKYEIINDIENNNIKKQHDNIKSLKAKVTVNDIPLKSASDLYGEFKYVVFIPDDLMLIKGSPELRRVYLDNIAVLQNKTHKRIMSDYKNALQQRNALAYEIFTKSNNTNISILEDLLKDWNDVTAKQGLNLTYGRLKFFNLLNKYTEPFYSEISYGGEFLKIFYISSVFGEIEDSLQLDFENKEQLYNIYMEKLNEKKYMGFNDNKFKKKESFNSQYANVKGPHKDDLIFTINGKNAREFGSQGQLRSAALIMKLSEAEIIRDYNKEKPVILLDEVLGELDEMRRKFIINHFEKSQVFITSCNKNDFNSITKTESGVKLWKVENGNFYED